MCEVLPICGCDPGRKSIYSLANLYSEKNKSPGVKMFTKIKLLSVQVADENDSCHLTFYAVNNKSFIFGQNIFSCFCQSGHGCSKSLLCLSR